MSDILKQIENYPDLRHICCQTADTVDDAPLLSVTDVKALAADFKIVVEVLSKSNNALNRAAEFVLQWDDGAGPATRVMVTIDDACKDIAAALAKIKTRVEGE